MAVQKQQAEPVEADKAPVRLQLNLESTVSGHINESAAIKLLLLVPQGDETVVANAIEVIRCLRTKVTLTHSNLHRCAVLYIADSLY